MLGSRICKSPFSCLENYILDNVTDLYIFELNDPVYLIKFVTSLHLGHTFNNLMYLWYIIDSPNIFPIPQIVIFVDHSSNNNYINFYMNFFIPTLKRINPNVQIYYRNFIVKMMRRTNVFCFSNAYINQEVHVGGFGGYFINRKSRLRFKDSVYDFIKFNKTEAELNKDKNKIINILIVGRYNRNIQNAREIAFSIQRICNEMNVDFIVHYLFDYEDYNPQSQITFSFNIDIYISPHGTSLFNTLWLNSNKCVIELFPAFFIRTDWMYSSFDFDLYYYPVFSSTYYNWEYLSMYHRGSSPSLMYKLKNSYLPNYREDFYVSTKQVIQSFHYCINKLVSN